MHLQVALHDFGEQVRKDEYLALALIGMRKIAESLADELAIHLAFVVAHLFITHCDADVTPSEQKFLDHGEHGLTARGAGILHRFDGLCGQAGHHCHQTGEQPLLVQRNVAGGADRTDIQHRGLHFNLTACAENGVLNDLRHRHGHEFSKLRLMVGCDVNAFHKTPLRMT